MKVIYKRSLFTIEALTDDDNFLGSWECHNDFEEGYNDYGQERESLPLGVYDHITAELTPEDEQEPAYGTFYITTGDYRGRDIHGGGSSLDDPYAPYQGWCPTYGCLRMQNADGEELSRLIIDANDNDEDVTLYVEE